MKLSVGLVSLAVLLSSSAVNAGVAHQHHNRRNHHVKRDMITETIKVTQYLTVDQYGQPWPGQPTATASPPEDQYKAQAHVEVEAKPTPKPTIKPVEEYTSTTEAKPTTSVKPPKPETPPTHVGGDPDAEFPDGEIDCSTFPSDYGALALDWLECGGWTGIQIDGGAGEECKEGGLCSYACPPGYSKAQWPEIQPASGESHGGLLCKNGKLWKTRPENSGLCVKGHGGVFVENKLGEHVPICRTDYPGKIPPIRFDVYEPCN